MTQENKELLLVDLCARLPCGVIVYDYDRKETREMGLGTLHDIMFNDLECKPYLRPMRSITEEEIKELSKIDMKRVIFSSRHLTWHLDGEIIDYLNKKMLDWRGLIPRGLALEAPEDMYKLNEK